MSKDLLKRRPFLFIYHFEPSDKIVGYFFS
jgi:hypothetical protein